MNLDIPYIICSILSFVPAIVLHEIAHGFVANKMGDPTAKRMGRLSLNPLKHIDPFGTVIMPIMLMLLNWPVFGYAKPVPYNPTYFKDIRKGELLVGLAGPCANLVLALIAALVSWALWPYAVANQDTLFATEGFFYYFYLLFLPYFILINLYLMFFNLLPIPPLDGASIIGFLLPVKYLPTYYRIQQYALPVFFALVLLVPYIFNINPIGAYLQVTAGNLFSVLSPIA